MTFNFTGKKITLATVKSFIRKAGDELHISTKSRFDGMTDGCESCADQSFRKVTRVAESDNTLGINGAWFVGGSRNLFEVVQRDGFYGIEIYNCCGTFILAVKQDAPAIAA